MIASLYLLHVHHYRGECITVNILCISCRIEPLCSHFKLLRMLEQAVSQGLTEIDALLGLYNVASV